MLDIDLSTVANVRHLLATFMLACACVSVILFAAGYCQELDEREGKTKHR